jgi:sugar O-acyltransferase (sialic acid O-acetyltransferase NeuD family)
MAADLVIVGAGGHGREVLGLVRAVNAAAPAPVWHVVGFADDGDLDAEAVGRLDRLDTFVSCRVDAVGSLSTPPPMAVVALGLAAARREVTDRLLAQGVALAPALVHPAATVGPDVRLDPGVVVAAGSHITTNVDLGAGVQVNVGCTISHDVVVGPHATLSPGVRLTGGVEVGPDVFFGVGAVVGPRVSIGAGARVGAGAVVLHDVAPGTTVHGAPARPSTRG